MWSLIKKKKGRGEGGFVSLCTEICNIIILGFPYSERDGQWIAEW